MAREASIEINFSHGCEDAVCLLDILCNGGWTVYNEKGNVEYLPIGDNDMFCWQEDNISYEQLKEIVIVKQKQKELIGVELLYEDTNCGISLLFRNLHDILISIDINRRTINSERDSLTDFEWYFSKIIKMICKDESILLSYKFHDYID